ncbi:MICOS complex subunit MIC60 [Romboutsia lituseburensis]|uniref:MICOS complex subunit MIC60 n=1 Tax=Romboutsia lituseburensis TaxID=1537 RepID=UPI00215A30F5|nr:MICOS complex subunit MIC60 [Romboutsia lituseburensis]MCR8746530.1 MICOS complex subunit MIC60 [Romboutsia lituseburensis]
MNNIAIGIRDVIREFDITKNKIEFTNDLNIFLNISAFNESTGEYYDVIKSNFNDYMKKWNIDINNKFLILSKYIKSRKLPYKIAKDEGFEMIKSEKFIISMLVELYAMNIIMENENVSKQELSKFIQSELELNDLKIAEKDIILNDLDYYFKEKKLMNLCRENMMKNDKELKNALEKTVKEVERRKKVKINLETKIINSEIQSRENVILNNESIIQENIQLRQEIEKLKKEIDITNSIINEHMDKEICFQNEITKLQKDNIDLLNYGKIQYEKALVDLVKNMNDDTNGNLLDRLYCYCKGSKEQNLMFIATNFFNVFRQMGISPRETIKLGSSVSIEEYSFYNYRLNKDISDIKLCEGNVIYPSWFYNSTEILKPYVNVRGE